MTSPLRGLTALQDACTVLRDSAVAVFGTYEVDLPDRRIVTVERPAGDTEQLAVYVARIYPGVPGAEAGRPVRCGGPVVGEVVLELWRCHPVPEDGMTTAEQEIAIAAKRHGDMLLMIASCDAAVSQLELDGEALVGSGQILIPGGGMAGLRALMTIPIPRPEPDSA